MSKVGFRMENNTFKGSLFGGFNREDVIDYIRKTSAESTARIESLEGDIDKLCAQEQELRTQVSSRNIVLRDGHITDDVRNGNIQSAQAVLDTIPVDNGM